MSRLLINNYYKEVEQIINYGGSRKETSIRVAFQNLLNNYCQTRDFLLIPELDYRTKSGKLVYPDGTIKDALRLDWGYWESKDKYDNLDVEIENKLAAGYPDDNILFEDSQTAILIQGGAETLRVSIKKEEDLDKIINLFINYVRPEIEDFHQAINIFQEDIPTILETLRNLIENEDKNNRKFQQARNKFLTLCQESINPQITLEDVREMMIQHILTEDIFFNIFNESQFHQENNIASELQGIIETFFKSNVKRTTLGSIERYYNVIKRTAANISNHHEKQKFLKVIYENFYKAYNPLAADKLGIVYTPQEIVKFMIESTDYLVHKHFNRLLADPDIEILDPATGTGTFITELIDYLPSDKLKYKYLNDIHCNEVSILPYYIANLNIEYSYKQKMGEYLEFNNICFVDTLDHTSYHLKQGDLFAMSLENTERIKRQNDRKISVIIGNPPYNAKQENFSQNNANRSYESIDKRIKDTYVKEGKAQNQIVLYDMYVRFIRWASDRLNNNGIIAFITNNSFIDALTFDGFRKVLSEEFNHIYTIDLGGNIRQGDKTGNVFNIMVGVSITFLVRKKDTPQPPLLRGEKDDVKNGIIYYYKLAENNAKEKLDFLTKNKLKNISFTHILPNKNNWINLADNDFDDLLPLIDKDVKSGKSEESIFKLFSRGIVTQRDEWVYDFSQANLTEKMQFLISIYQQTLQDNNFEDKNVIKWDAELTTYLKRKIEKDFNSEQIFLSLYRPFTKQYFYFDKHFNGRTYQWFNIYNKADSDNKYIAYSALGNSKPFHCLAINCIAELHITGDSQCLPLYRYENGEKIDNITDWGLKQFREYYTSPPAPSPKGEEGERLSPDSNSRLNSNSPLSSNSPLNSNYPLNSNSPLLLGEGQGVRTNNPLGVTDSADSPLSFRRRAGGEVEKIDIFHYIYAVLHNPKYREKYELNLKRDFPRIPFYDNFWQWANWGKKLMELHLNYETIKPYPLKIINIGANTGVLPLPKPKLKADKINHKIIIDEVTTLENIPKIVWEYKLGNRSALEWILDQYKEKKTKDKTIAEKFNNYQFADYKDAVIDLLMRVTTVSIETMKIIKTMDNGQ